MKLYSVGYDLHGEEKDYKTLYQILGAMKGKRMLDSHWVFRSSLKAKQLRKLMKLIVNDDDEFFICEIVKGNVSGQFRKK